MKPVSFDYEAPRDVDAAIALSAGADGMGKYVAGGQSLGPMLNLRLVQPQLLIDLRRIEAMQAVSESPDAIRYGACTRHAAIEDGRVPDATGGFLRRVAGGIAYRAVRNRGTIGGSLAHADPAADWVSAMTAAGASIVIGGPAGERTVPMEDFMLGAFTTALDENEILLAVEVPRAGPDARWGYYKICRKAGEYAHAIGAVARDPARGHVRAVVGAADGAPIVLDGQDPEERLPGALDRAGIADPVKRRLLTAALRRALLQVQE